ncbi:MAG: ATP-binding cassette domain-containing protein [Pseudorhodoplanes sp.]|uniref:branched-chain amino acid ABC transporter ATP-binding protein/permease n=1 Tax=Pseudorhodoplanes sp. TaxID=1934341 RepID=UPI003D0CA614
MERGLLAPLSLIVGLLALYLAAAFFVTNTYYQLILTSIPIWATLAIGWNVFSGYVGLLSFGHAAFFGIGAFVVTLLFTLADVTPWVGIPIGGIVGAAAAVLIGLPTFRLRGHYFALAMVAYPLALLYVFNWLGFHEVTLPLKREAPAFYMQFANPYVYTLLAAGLLLVGMVIACLIDRSRFGLVLRAIKQDEAAASASGINPRGWKLAALMISAVLSALAGGLYVVVLNVTTPNEVFGLVVSSTPLVLSMFGGIGSIWGPLIGAFALVPISETLHAELGSIFPGVQGVVYGLALVLLMLWLPEGIYWKLHDRFSRVRVAPSRITTIQRSLPLALAKRLDSIPRGTPVLALSGVSCQFGGLKVFKSLDLTIESGSITGVVGPNGAGKTTLFNVINGFVSPSEGEVVLLGSDLTGMAVYARARLGLARTFQTPRIFPRFTVLDNVYVGAVSANYDTAQSQSAATWAVAFCELDDVAHKLAGSLSAMHVRKIEIARAIAGCPTVLLLDETLAGLAVSEIEEILKIVRRLRVLGITVVIIEHTMDAMVRLVDRMVVLDRGRLIADGDPESVVRKRSVVEAYLGAKWAKRVA